jgi:hypothetical protein
MKQSTYSFNISNQIVEFSDEELEKFPNCVFSKLALNTTQNSAILIERDNKFLDFIVSYIKYDAIPKTPSLFSNLMEEAQFYGVYELVDELKTCNTNSSLRFDGAYIFYVAKSETNKYWSFYLTFAQNNVLYVTSGRDGFITGTWKQHGEEILLHYRNEEKCYTGKMRLKQDISVIELEFANEEQEEYGILLASGKFCHLSELSSVLVTDPKQAIFSSF